MGTPHKATPEQWRILQDYAVCADYLEERNDHTGARWLRKEVGE